MAGGRPRRTCWSPATRTSTSGRRSSRRGWASGRGRWSRRAGRGRRASAPRSGVAEPADMWRRILSQRAQLPGPGDAADQLDGAPDRLRDRRRRDRVTVRAVARQGCAGVDERGDVQRRPTAPASSRRTASTSPSFAPERPRHRSVPSGGEPPGRRRPATGRDDQLAGAASQRTSYSRPIHHQRPHSWRDVGRRRGGRPPRRAAAPARRRAPGRAAAGRAGRCRPGRLYALAKATTPVPAGPVHRQRGEVAGHRAAVPDVDPLADAVELQAQPCPGSSDSRSLMTTGAHISASVAGASTAGVRSARNAAHLARSVDGRPELPGRRHRAGVGARLLAQRAVPGVHDVAAGERLDRVVASCGHAERVQQPLGEQRPTRLAGDPLQRPRRAARTPGWSSGSVRCGG